MIHGKQKNIYDFAGNSTEWTSEKINITRTNGSTVYSSARSVKYALDFPCSASYREWSNGATSVMSYRVALFIK